MNDDFLPGAAGSLTGAGIQQPGDIQTLGSSTLYNLLEEMVRLRGRNEAQHKLFEQALARMRDQLKASFDSFAADTQRAYQTLRQEINGEKRASMTFLGELLEINQDLEDIAAAAPPVDDPEAVARWIEAVRIQS